eukprot:3516631-Lingulodinium_polyedra.AAC.1
MSWRHLLRTALTRPSTCALSRSRVRGRCSPCEGAPGPAAPPPPLSPARPCNAPPAKGSGPGPPVPAPGPQRPGPTAIQVSATAFPGYGPRCPAAEALGR